MTTKGYYTTKKHYLSIKLLIAVIIIFIVAGISSSSLAAAVQTEVKKTDLVLVTDYTRDFNIDIKYATCDNFVGKAMYPSPTCVLTKGTLDKLIKANNLIKKQGYYIKIWDAYRPLSVQKIMWEATPNKNYVANPYRSGSKHNRGAAVDVTLVDKSGKEVKMPTGFDNFTEKASPNYKGMTAEQRKNLNILSKAMTASGFRTISTEWWHFEDTEYANYKTQDLSLSKFDKTNHILTHKTISNLKFLNNSNTSQLIVVTSVVDNTSNVIINTYEKNINGWVNVHNNITGYIGMEGFTNNKKEGDKKTPVGAYGIGTCFSKTSNIATGLEFYKYDSKDVWVDDPKSLYYNTHQREPVNGRWNSAENFSKMKNGVYDVFFNLEYNSQKISYKGSAIFFHIINPNMQIKYTNGCVAADRKNVLSIVKWLDKKKSPMILLGPLSGIAKY
ncbi:MAG: D-alanyl-D-alanine dipeptidase [Eubacterium sp.]|nr:D-alanyl-D-alanine dipeptidase [Eubacterium sp.]